MWGEQTSEQKMNQKGVGEIFRKWQGAERWVIHSQGAWRGPCSRGGAVEEAWGAVRCYRKSLPYLRRLTLPPPSPAPSRPPHPWLNMCWEQTPA